METKQSERTLGLVRKHHETESDALYLNPCPAGLTMAPVAVLTNGYDAEIARCHKVLTAAPELLVALETAEHMLRNLLRGKTVKTHFYEINALENSVRKAIRKATT